MPLAADTLLGQRTVFEYSMVSLGTWSAVEQKEILGAVEHLSRPGGQEAIKLVVQAGQVALQSTQFVGLFQLGPLRLQVLPKMHRQTTSTAEAQQQAMQNLFFMLRYALDLPIHTAHATQLEVGTDWFEALTTLFTESLLAEWQRGPVRRYESVQDDLTTIRGRLRVQDHLRRPALQHLLPVEFDEFTTDTRLNRLFRFVVARLSALSRSNRNLDNLRTLAAWMDEDGVPLLSAVDVAEVLRLRLDRLHTRYELPLALAQLFVQDAGLNAHTGEQGAQSLFFDMNTLFEAFLTGVLLQHRDEIVPDALRLARIVVQGEGQRRPLLIRQSTGKGTLHMKPDVLLSLSGQVPVIVDFKYKLLKPGEARAGVAREDLYQMFAYAQRYECPQVLLVYPSVPQVDTSTLRYRVPDDGGTSAQLRVAMVNLHHDFSVEGVQSLISDLQLILGGKND